MDSNEGIQLVSSIRIKAEEIFNDLKLGLLHSVIVVCFERKQSVHCYSDPEDLKLREDLLLAYENVSHTRTKNRKHVCINNNANVNEIDENYFEKNEFDSLITTIVEQRNLYHEFKIFVSSNIRPNNKTEKVYVVLKFYNKIYNEVYKLPINFEYRLRLYTSIIDSTVNIFFNEISKNGKQDNECFEISNISKDSVIKTAGKYFLCTPVANLRNGDSLFWISEKINRIAFLKYEKKQIKQGGIILTYKNNPIITYNIKFREPVLLSNSKRIRKLLEITNKNNKLVSDGSVVFGIGAITTGYNPQQGDVYEIRFNKQYNWTLLHDKKEVLNYYLEFPSLPRNIIPIDFFEEKFCYVFGESEINKNKADALYKIVFNIIEEHCGAVLVITENVNKEVERLRNQSTLIEPIKVGANFVRRIIKIDGAIMMDTDCICYAIGVILDGEAVQDKGDPSRGARYNSSIRYYYSQKENCKIMIVVISDDGDVNILPD